jgi:pSer/pThr/pTyr-binding forkhead associated (FHA) protein
MKIRRCEMDNTINIQSSIGKRLDQIKKTDSLSILFDGKKIPLVSVIKVGRDRSNDIVLDDKLVSRNHALIQKIKSDYFIKDLNSSNGTFVNKQKVPKNKYIKLKQTDVIRIGKTDLVMK